MSARNFQSRAAVRGTTRLRKADGAYRAALRGDASQARALVETVANELLSGDFRVEHGKVVLTETRRVVEHSWRSTIDILQTQGHCDLAADARRFVEQIPPPMAEKEQLANALLQAGR